MNEHVEKALKYLKAKNLTNKEEIRDYHQKKLIKISNLKLDI